MRVYHPTLLIFIFSLSSIFQILQVFCDSEYKWNGQEWVWEGGEELSSKSSGDLSASSSNRKRQHVKQNARDRDEGYSYDDGGESDDYSYYDDDNVYENSQTGSGSDSQYYSDDEDEYYDMEEGVEEKGGSGRGGGVDGDEFYENENFYDENSNHYEVDESNPRNQPPSDHPNSSKEVRNNVSVVEDNFHDGSTNTVNSMSQEEEEKKKNVIIIDKTISDDVGDGLNSNSIDDQEDDMWLRRGGGEKKEGNVSVRMRDDFVFHSFLTRPQTLVAMIGGSIVGLFFAIICVMFGVYRMRRKQELRYEQHHARRHHVGYFPQSCHQDNGTTEQTQALNPMYGIRMERAGVNVSSNNVIDNSSERGGLLATYAKPPPLPRTGQQQQLQPSSSSSRNDLYG